MKRIVTSLIFASLGATSMTSAANANNIVYSAPDKGFVVVGGIGYSWLKGNELVYDAGDRISHLIWETNAPVLTLGAHGVLYNSWTVSANVAVGFSGNSYMEDYDWLTPYRNSFNFNEWTHRSVHPNTSLDRYVDFDIAVGHDFTYSQATKINLHGGFKYTNVKWTATGGDFVYSVTGFRSNTGSFPNVPGITYEQRMPGLFLGASMETNHGDWTFSGVARGGITIGATAVDHHWARDLRFNEDYGSIPFISLGAKVDYSVSQATSIFLGVDYDHYFRSKAPVTMYNIPTGALVGGPIVDGGGMDFTAFKLHGGLKVAF